MQVEPNTLFLWPKGQRLTPTQAVMLMLPGGLVQGSEEIGSISEPHKPTIARVVPSKN
jgi:hypothetical protein